MQPRYTEFAHNGALVQVLSDDFKVSNPDLYNRALRCGGAMSLNLPNGLFGYEGVIYRNAQVIMLDAYVKTLTEQEYQAILEHETAHIRLGHTDLAQSGIIVDENLEVEADAAAIKAVGAAAMLGAMNKSIGFFMTSQGCPANKFTMWLIKLSYGKVARNREKILKSQL